MSRHTASAENPAESEGDGDTQMNDKIKKHRALLKLCRDLFTTSNLLGADFDDVQVFEVTKRNFVQQPGGGGVHVSFSVSGHAIGKTGKDAHEALAVLLPGDDEDA